MISTRTNGAVRSFARAAAVAALTVGALGAPAMAQNATLTSSLSLGTDSDTRAVAVEGNFAFVARGAFGCDVINRADPAHPVRIATISPDPGGVVEIRDVAVLNGRLYLGNDSGTIDSITGNYTGVYIYDVSNPAAPARLGEIVWGGGYWFHTAGMVYNLEVAEIGASTYGFFVSDITNACEMFRLDDPSLPVWVGTLLRPEMVSGICENVTIQDGRAYVSWLQGGISIHDISGIASLGNEYSTEYYPQNEAPRLVHVGGLGNTRGLAPSEDGLQLAVTGTVGSGAGQLRLLDISNLGAVTTLGTFSPGTSSMPSNIAIAGRFAHVAWGTEGLRVIDISQPAALFQIARYDTANARGVAVSGPHTLIADGSQHLLTVDLQDTVTITRATWGKFSHVLTIEATSSVQPRVSMEVVGRGTMTYNGSSGRYVFTQTVNPKPATVRVTSELGGTTTASVSKTNN